MKDSEIESILKDKFPNKELAVVDMTGTQNHFEIRISNDAFGTDLSRIEKHQLLMQMFDSQIKSGEIHALAIKVF